jgi:hypothetical protein
MREGVTMLFGEGKERCTPSHNQAKPDSPKAVPKSPERKDSISLFIQGGTTSIPQAQHVKRSGRALCFFKIGAKLAQNQHMILGENGREAACRRALFTLMVHCDRQNRTRSENILRIT